MVVQMDSDQIKTCNTKTTSLKKSNNTIAYQLDKKNVISSCSVTSDGKLYSYLKI